MDEKKIKVMAEYKRQKVNINEKDNKTVSTKKPAAKKTDSKKPTVKKLAERRKDMSKFNDIFEAAAQGTVEDVRYFIEQKGVSANVKDEKYGSTSLFKTLVNNNRIEIAKYLVSAGADVNARDKNGNVLLYIMGSGWKIDLAKYLISQGANVNAKNNKGETPLHYAVWNAILSKNFEFVKFLISQEADINAKDNERSTPLHKAVGGIRNIELAEYLISQGADINAENDLGVIPQRRLMR